MDKLTQWVQAGVSQVIDGDMAEFWQGNRLIAVILKKPDALGDEGFKFDVFGFGGDAGVSHKVVWGKKDILEFVENYVKGLN